MDLEESDNEKEVEQDEEMPDFMINKNSNENTQDLSRNSSNLNQINVRSRNRNALDIPEKRSPLLPKEKHDVKNKT